MPTLKLLSNGAFHVMVDAEGSGWSRAAATAVTRWTEDAVLDRGGSYFYLRDADDDHVWSATARPMGGDAQTCDARFDADRATFTRRDHEMEVTTTVAVAADRDIELRRMRIVNLAARRRRLCVTSCAEAVMNTPAADATHPAFSKLFVETEIDDRLQAIFASRRPSKPDDKRPWCLHLAVVPGDAEVSFETDRQRFIGRDRDLADPVALRHSEPLSGTAGPVLDPVLAIRVPIELEPGAELTIDWFTGIADSRAEAAVLAAACRADSAGDEVLAHCGRQREKTLARMGANEDDARAFEALASALLFADAQRRGSPNDITANRSGQSGLWKFGVSGDVPLIWLRLSGSAESAKKWVAAHAFWKAHGINTELLASGDNNAIEAVRQAAGDDLDKPGGIVVRNSDDLDVDDRVLLAAAARLVIDDDLPMGNEKTEFAPDRTRRVIDAPATDAGNPGAFTADQREFVMTVSNAQPTPLPWTNVIANADFGTLISASGSACTWRENSHEFRLTPWSNDPVSDPNSEAIYIRDEETQRCWSPTLLPMRGDGAFEVRHGFGYSVFEHSEAGIASTLTVFVAADAPVKLSLLQLRNDSAQARRLTVTGHVDWVLGDERAKTLMHVVTEVDDGALFARNAWNTDFAGRTAFFDVDGADRSHSADRGDFFGRGGSRAMPAAMREAHLSGRVGAALDPCASLRVAVELAPGATHELVFRLGAGASTDEARDLVRRWRGADAAHAALRAVQQRWQHTLGAIQVRTPDAAVNALVNGWLPYQTLASRVWGRTAFYQSSGGYGFRDQLQDVMALVHAAPGVVREHLLRAASRQFVEGDVQHWWHPPSGKGVRTRCSDDYLWLPLAVSRYVEVTGDDAVLDEKVPFLDSRPLKDGEESNYEAPPDAAEAGSLYAHCARALRRAVGWYGARGLPLMHAGDWNDGMNLVGAGGKGESVWMAFFLITVLKRFAPLARERGDRDFAELCGAEAAALAERVEATSWDGHWYQRATYDDGTPLGSAANDECRIDAIAQSWSVLSGAAPADRARQAMDSLHDQLVDAHTRIVKLLAPPFNKSQPWPGYIQGYVPGVRENGGQYTHAAVWAAMAFAALGDARRAWQLFDLLAPMHHTTNAVDTATYQLEPYVVAGDVYAFAPHAGRGGWSWYTGSAAWMYQFIVESLLGLQRRGNQLCLRPLVPEQWSGFQMSYRFGSARYEITCQVGQTASVSVDGIALTDPSITMTDDGKAHAVVVEVIQQEAKTCNSE